jgi:MarR family 2-MHQ and catechol resistance regulon transcriptional repressor
VSPKPNAPTLWLALMHAHAAMDRAAQESIRHTGLCYTDFEILESLLHRGPLPVNAIATDIHITSGSMTTAVDRLAARGLVKRTENPTDRRSRLVRLTSDGRALIEGSYATHAADLNRLVDGALTAPERAELFVLLRKLEKGVPPA